MSESGHRGAFVFGLILGAVGGALAALFMTPKSGQEIREQIKGQTGPVQERLSSATAGVRERTTGVQDRLTTATSGVRERADGVIGASKDKVTQLKQRGQEAEDQVVSTVKADAPEPSASDTPAQAAANGTEAVTEAVEQIERQEPASPSAE